MFIEYTPDFNNCPIIEDLITALGNFLLPRQKPVVYTMSVVCRTSLLYGELISVRLEFNLVMIKKGFKQVKEDASLHHFGSITLYHKIDDIGINSVDAIAILDFGYITEETNDAIALMMKNFPVAKAVAEMYYDTLRHEPTLEGNFYPPIIQYLTSVKFRNVSSN